MSSKPKKRSPRRLMYVENKSGTIEGVKARIGWVEFSKTGQTLYYRGLMLQKGTVPRGNCFDVVSSDVYWVADVKTRGLNARDEESEAAIEVDPDALDEYQRLKAE
jgi:hypothetical protein